MTLSSTTTKTSYNGDGSTTAFATGFKFVANAHVKVIVRDSDGGETVWTEGTQYALTGAGDDSGGTVTVTTTPTDYTPATGTTLVIKRSTPETQGTALPAGGAFPSGSVEQALDALTMLVQQHSEEIARALTLAETSPTLGLVMPEPSANKLLGWNSTATNLENKVATDLDLAMATAFAATLMDDADAAAARTTLSAQADVITSQGDLVIGDASGDPVRLALGAAGTAPVSDGTTLVPIGILKQGRHTIWVPATAMTARTTSGPASGTVETSTNKVMLKTLDFDANTDEFAQFSVAMPKSWNVGTVTAEFVWSHPATSTTFGVVWGLQGLALSDDDAVDQAFGTAQTATDTGGTTDDLYVSPETAAITIGNTPAESDAVVFQVYRDADAGGDTLAVDARLHGVRLFLILDAGDDA